LQTQFSFFCSQIAFFTRSFKARVFFFVLISWQWFFQTLTMDEQQTHHVFVAEIKLYPIQTYVCRASKVGEFSTSFLSLGRLFLKM
jgi:hypothetical protein